METSFISSLLLITAVTGGLAVLVAALLGWANSKLPKDETALVDAIEALLPHTQCAQCGYPGCRPYAEAVATGEALDLCPPGGPTTLIALQDLLGQNLPGSHSSEVKSEVKSGVKPELKTAALLEEPVPLLAIIDESRCIGCALCIPPCPVDAILGTNKYMHTVLSQHCTGCELCIAPCPVDCISLIPASPAV